MIKLKKNCYSELSKPSLPVKDIKTGEEILKELYEYGKRNGYKYLCAKQIGINRSVCYVDIIDKIFLINSFYKKSENSKKHIYVETSASFDYPFKTVRWDSIEVVSDTFANNMFYEIGDTTQKNYSIYTDVKFIEVCYIQHIIDMDRGIISKKFIK